MTEPVAYLTALAISACFSNPLPLTRADATTLFAIADELRRLRAELEQREK